MPAIRERREYSAINGAPFPADKAQEVGEHLHGLARGRLKELTAQQVLEDAAREDSPLHDYFTWDDTEAARKYREWQARHLINHIQVRVVRVGDEKPVRAFVNVVMETAHGAKRVYVDQSRAVQRSELRDQLLDRAKETIRHWRERFREVTELSGIHRAIDETLERLDEEAA